MFTGIIEERGTIKAILKGSRSVCLTVAANVILEDIKIGDSINTNGICLTVVSFNKEAFSADVMPETMRRTNLKYLSVGSTVNLERALKLNDRMSGHMVSGHIDGTGIIRKIWEEDNSKWFTIAADKTILRYIVEKGSVALDGISLTVTRVNDDSFDVSVIPHTRSVTTITEKKTGDTLNIECDLIAKYIEKFLGQGIDKGKISLDFLAEHGFV